MTQTAPVPYAKMNGLGNEILVVDLRGSSHVLTPKEARDLAEAPDLRFDQLMALHAPQTAGTAAFVRIYNTDGSASGACGNGTRCIGWLEARQTGRPEMVFETDAGLLDVRVESQARITVDMGRPKFGWQDIPLSEPFHDTRRIELQVGPIDAPVLHSPSVASMGNPHAVFWVDDPHAYDLGKLGPLLENHPIFPERANISLAHVTARDALTLRTWERGAGLTRACGSAACAAAVCGARTNRTGRTVTVTVPGGPLVIEWRADDHVLMTGPVEIEHEGAFEDL